MIGRLGHRAEPDWALRKAGGDWRLGGRAAGGKEGLVCGSAAGRPERDSPPRRVAGR